LRMPDSNAATAASACQSYSASRERAR
jgi:hypothetical protein